jgi:FAD/FMN-containing dehydrogenase
VSQPERWDRARVLEKRDAVAGLVYDVVATFDGSFSAEHGIGVLKRDALVRYRSGEELALMRTLKKALDPDNILNPGKVL